MAGVKISITQVLAAEKVVDDAVTQMNGVAQKVLAQAGASEAAILAPAGQISSQTYTGLGGSGRALAETLDQLKADLGKLRATAEQGSDQATQTARSAASSSVAQGM
jgi:hypothetical protein